MNNVEDAANQPLLPRLNSSYGALCNPPDLTEEDRGWNAYQNLDVFFTRLYRYWQEKGFAAIVAARLVNLAGLAFTIAMAGFLLLVVNFSGLSHPCLQDHDNKCDIAQAAFYKDPFSHGSALSRLFKFFFLGIFSLYWLWTAAASLVEVWQMWDIRCFCRNKMGLSDTTLGHLPWPELLQRIVAVQQDMRYTLYADLTQHDVVMRIMRKDDYLIGMLNHGVLDLHAPLPGLRSRPLLTTTVTWLLRVCMLDAMFDDSFELQQPFLRNATSLRQRFRTAAVMTALLSPFMLLFLVMHFLLKHLERIYHHPSSLGKRRWSTYAYWRMREYGELPHFVELRLNSAAQAASKYCAQFPSPVTGTVAGLVAYVGAGVAALVIGIALTHDYLMERPLWGHTLVWWLAGCGMVLAVARSLMEDEAPMYNPEGAMREVVAHTHWVPPYWQGKAHSSEVRSEFSGLFQYQMVLYFEEALSVVLLPWLCILLARSSHDIISFLHKNTVYHSNVGHVCSMAHFDLDPYGNPRFAPASAFAHQNPEVREQYQKIERSLVSFAACYPSWKPSDKSMARFIDALDPAVCAAAKQGGAPGHRGGPVGRAAPLAASAMVPGPAIAGGWALMPQLDGIPSGGGHPHRVLLSRGGSIHLDHTVVDMCPGEKGVRIPKNIRGWEDLEGSEGQEVGSPDSHTHSVELQRIGLPPPKPKAPTGAIPGGFKKSQGSERMSQQAQHASDLDGSESQRFSYGWVADAELQDLNAPRPTSNSVQNSMQNSRASPRDQNCAANDGAQNARERSADGAPVPPAAAGPAALAGPHSPPAPSSPLRRLGSSNLQACNSQGLRSGDAAGLAAAPDSQSSQTHSQLTLNVPATGAMSPGGQPCTPRTTSEWANSSSSLHIGLHKSNSFGPQRQHSGSMFGASSAQFMSPMGSMAWSALSGSGAGIAQPSRSDAGGPHVGHWHWASSAPSSRSPMPSMRQSMLSSRALAGDQAAWVYSATGDGDEAMFGSMGQSMQSSLHASVDDTEFRRVYMQAALQRSYELARSQQMNRSAQAASAQS